MTTDSLEEDDALLVLRAKSAMQHAYAPYSHFRVGAALLTRDGTIFSGCNVENASFGATLCAERTAVVKMISEGKHEPIAIAVHTESEACVPPCGLCRQVLREFAPDLRVLLSAPGGVQVTSLVELFPQPFVLHRGG